MSDKIARLGIERDNDLMYYIKNGDVWATPRKQKGQPKGRPQKVASTGLEMDYSRYIYFLDGDGDVARKARHVGGGKKSRAPKTRAPSRGAAPARATNGGTRAMNGGAKSPSQLEREIEECLKKSGAGGGKAAHARRRGGRRH